MSNPGTTPAGSLVQVSLDDGIELTIHMNAAVAPDWPDFQSVGRIVVESDVPVDRGILQRLPCVHRIRCETHGTTRRVLIGTQTACGTRWFRTDPVHPGPVCLITPALDDLPSRPVAPTSRRGCRRKYGARSYVLPPHAAPETWPSPGPWSGNAPTSCADGFHSRLRSRRPATLPQRGSWSAARRS